MDSDPEPPSPRRPSLALVVIVLLFFYVLSYFPAVSFMTRYPENQRYSAIYRPLPRPIRAMMLRVWMRLDPAGAEITNRAAEEYRRPAVPVN